MELSSHFLLSPFQNSFLYKTKDPQKRPCVPLDTKNKSHKRQKEEVIRPIKDKMGLKYKFVYITLKGVNLPDTKGWRHRLGS